MSLAYAGTSIRLYDSENKEVGQGFVNKHEPGSSAGDHQALALDRAIEQFKTSDGFKKMGAEMMSTLNLKVELLVHTAMH